MVEIISFEKAIQESAQFSKCHLLLGSTACCPDIFHHYLSDNDGQVFTLNYDLLLCWPLMHKDMQLDDPITLSVNDGFGNDEDDPDADYVLWQGETAAHAAKVHFLHGALHLFDARNELQKLPGPERMSTLSIERARPSKPMSFRC